MAERPDAVVRILVSYWYWGRERRAARRDLATDLVNATRLPVRLFADSGAFSAYTLRSGGGTISLPDYAAWLTDNRPLLSVMANLDVIGDPAATARNQLALEGRGLPVLPIYHMQTPLTELAALCRDYRYVAVGGTATLRGRQKMQATARAALVARDHGTVLHGLGRSASDELLAVPFWSVDSTTWIHGKRYGHLQLFDGRRIKMTGLQQAARDPVLLRQHGMDPRMAARPDFANFGSRGDLGQYRAEAEASLRVAAVAWKRFEAYLQARHGVSPPPGYAETGTVVYFADDVLRHLQWLMRAIEWMTEKGEANEATRSLPGHTHGI